MNIILLSGGSGKRLWPLSNDIRSKQFIKIFKNPNGEYESMLQRVYRQIKNVDHDCSITIATSKTQMSAINNQLGDTVRICPEPCRKDTFAAISLATAYLHDIVGLSEDEAVVVCPIDAYVEKEYFEFLRVMYEKAQDNVAKLILMGIEPTYPSEKYGYIVPEDRNTLSTVKYFKEKPDLKSAKNLISEGAMWNGGVFAYKIEYILQKSKEILGYSTYKSLFENYENIEKISFDYAVAEKEKNMQVLRFSGAWKDIGTWNTLSETMDESIIGNAIVNDKCENLHIINELSIPILAMGISNAVISASYDGIIVSDKDQSSYIKPFVDKIDQQIMFAEKSWGSYQVSNIEDGSLTIIVTLNKGHSMNYHSHKNRDEIWIVVSGEGTTVIDGKVRKIKIGDVITMKCGSKHTVTAITELKMIEVQIGNDISVDDKEIFPLE